MKYGLMAVASAFALLATASVLNAAPAGRLGITGTNSSVIKVADADDVGVHHRRHRNGGGLAIVIGDGDEHRHHRRWRHHDDDDDDNHEHHRRWRHHHDDDDSGVSIRLGRGHRRHHVE